MRAFLLVRTAVEPCAALRGWVRSGKLPWFASERIRERFSRWRDGGSPGNIGAGRFSPDVTQ
jgi:hypothetical protein